MNKGKHRVIENSVKILHHRKQHARLQNTLRIKITSPAFTGVKIKSDAKPRSRACCATGEGITFLPLSLPEGG